MTLPPPQGKPWQGWYFMNQNLNEVDVIVRLWSHRQCSDVCHSSESGFSCSPGSQLRNRQHLVPEVETHGRFPRAPSPITGPFSARLISKGKDILSFHMTSCWNVEKCTGRWMVVQESQHLVNTISAQQDPKDGRNNLNVCSLPPG